MYHRCNNSVSAIFQVYGLTAADGARSWRGLSRLTADALPAEGAARGRMHIMGAGKWEGHESGTLDITREYLANLVAQFDAQKNPMLVDYDHSLPKRGDSRAAGWVHELAIEDDEDGKPQLWATEVEWTPAAAEAIRNKEYLFCSPFWAHDSKDRVSGKPTGPRMFDVALTNQPFFDGQNALTCSDMTAAAPPAPTDNEANPMDEFLAAVAKSSGLTPEAVLAALTAKADEIGAMLRDAPALKEGEEPPPPDPMMAGDMTAEKAARIASEAKLTGLVATVASMQATVNTMVASEAAAKKAAEDKAVADRTERIAAMVSDGRIGKSEETDAAKLLAYDAGLFEATYKDRKPTVPLGVKQAGDEPRAGAITNEHTVGLTASEQVAFKNLTEGAKYKPDYARTRILAQRPATN